MAIPFQTILHADWSRDARKRWIAAAVRTGPGWQVEAPCTIGDSADFVAALFSMPGPVLAGFDFPIGLPASYGQLTGFAGFTEALKMFGTADWAKFFQVADSETQVSLRQPFYPRLSSAEAKQRHLLEGLGMSSINELRRICEHATAKRRAACPLFWTLGGNQVGKAAIDGWQSVLQPAIRDGARLWPFDGSLASLARAGVPVIAETYPAEAYGHVGIGFKPRMSKQRQDDRRAAAAGLPAWAALHRIRFSDELSAQITEGFGLSKAGEDPFDALAGVLGMIEILDGRRPEAPTLHQLARQWEGWILGQRG
ncbi:hypothetical protein BKE38_09000 [Pseudoroseomonas deserti]|uniref:DUF429 domain-containing protein n=1 Tax=Teichococcus deserti TaxID=1817963 RepID=A0A1V2H3T3_9PROT|nr:DUF429 domain-containing protein [Pseudoroseomonas deserti]ONG55675.1 hypothetical protein BKE38_09000 [Pseudoroseomonas deserti]